MMSTRSGLWPESSELLSSAVKNSRYPRTSADEYFPWEGETARRERHRHRVKCSRKNGPRCMSNPQGPPPTVAWEERRILPGCRPAPDCEKSPAVFLLECAKKVRMYRRPSWA